MLSRAASHCSRTHAAPPDNMPKKKAAQAKEEPTKEKKTKTGPTPAEKLADELDDLMIAYLKACRDLGVTAVSRVLEKLDESVLDLGQYYLGERGGQALAACLHRNEAVEFLEDSEGIARRVLGGAHPVVRGIEHRLLNARVVLAAREKLMTYNN